MLFLNLLDKMSYNYDDNRGLPLIEIIIIYADEAPTDVSPIM